MKPINLEMGSLEVESTPGSTLDRVVVAYPSGNTTAIVFDQCTSVDRQELNEQVMRAWKLRNPQQPEIEQCCFVTPPRDEDAVARVEMFGGEFCGNAARSVIWSLVRGQDYRGKIEVSGAERPLACSVTDGEVKVAMPLPNDTVCARSVAEGSLVQLDGIAQLVATKRRDDQTPRQLLTSLLKRNAYDLCNQPAVGVSCYDKKSSEATFCVWVKEVDTIFDETACGSGTSAIGIALAVESRASMDIDVVQPSGETIRTGAIYCEGRVTSSWIAGKVAVLYDGEYTLT